MRLSEKTKLALDKKFQKVLRTPASFDFFVAIHDFIEYIELNAVLANGLSKRIKINRDLSIPAKYAYLKQIYQGLEDVSFPSDQDLGHERYMTVRDLHRIRNKEVSESISFWKKRESVRKFAVEVYERLHLHLSGSEK